MREWKHMKKFISIILLCVMVFMVLAGCGKQASGNEQSSQSAAIANPWSDWASVEEAEAAVGFSFGLPEVIADNFTAAVFRTMNDELIEIVYRDQDAEICVRKKAGEGQDLSGDYNQYETCTEEAFDGGTVAYYSNSGNNAVKLLVSYQGYSWSLVAADGWGEDSDWDFVKEISEQ